MQKKKKEANEKFNIRELPKDTKELLGLLKDIDYNVSTKFLNPIQDQPLETLIELAAKLKTRRIEMFPVRIID
jgi:hypothetical protein